MAAGTAATILAAVIEWCGAAPATIYYGALEGASKPAVLVAQKVFDQIPEYQEIKRRGLGPGDTDYIVLLTRANEKFYAALRRVVDTHGYDVVVEKGTHAFDGAPPDVTQAVIDALEK